MHKIRPTDVECNRTRLPWDYGLSNVYKLNWLLSKLKNRP